MGALLRKPHITLSLVHNKSVKMGRRITFVWLFKIAAEKAKKVAKSEFYPNPDIETRLTLRFNRGRR